MRLSKVPSAEVAAITAAAVRGECTNCTAPLPDPFPRFCPHCGQETNVKPPTVGEFMQQFSGTYFATEGALWRTFKLLLTQPGELTARYLNGRRKQYLLPLRLFLSITLVMLLTMRIVGAIQLSALEDPEFIRALPERPTEVALNLGFASAGLRDGTFFCHGLQARICKRVQKKLDTTTAQLLHEVQKVSDRIASHAGVVMFVLLPAFALGLSLLFRTRGFSYTEHLVFALHLHAFWFLMLTLMMLSLAGLGWMGWMGLLSAVLGMVLIWIPVYAGLAFRRVYGRATWRLLMRALLLMLIHGSLVVLIVALTALAALLL